MTSEERYRQALERIANLTHDEGCTSNCPLYECCCYEKGSRELALMALEGIDWEPASRKSRALEEFCWAAVLDIEEASDPSWQRLYLVREILLRLDESVFAGASLHQHRLILLARQHATPEEGAELDRLDEALP